ncbi:unnamed protein product [Paramecium primaurelia]|uniref:PSI domain-containing protein n=1 Tax=Paramecium primaurelia TaxID=5886 RepID=A0A8S1JUS1_PARPR|nr:unnamed protein product [Paramecium primaurelia]
MNIQAFLVLIVLLAVGTKTQSVSTDEKCTCSTVKSKFDCVALGCTFTPSTTTTAATCTSTPTALAVVSVYCGSISTPVTNCPKTRGCAFYDGKCQHFSGCQAFLKTTTSDCQAISTYCISDGVSCIDPKPCESYQTQTICNTNVSDTSTQLCIWDETVTPKCRAQKCSEAPQTLKTDIECDKFKTGCVTIGLGCADQRSLCSEYKSDCYNMIGLDGVCGSAADGSCIQRSCDSAPQEYTTDDQCNSYVQGCITNGSGCSNNPLPSCSEYKLDAFTCLKRMGSDGNCVGTSQNVCQVRTCENAPAEFFSTILCNQYLSGCKFNGINCVSELQNCSAYTGTKDTCAKYIGLTGQCWGAATNDSTSNCRNKMCSDGETSYNTDKLCSDFLTNCYTNGQGCTSEKKACSTFSGTTTTCSKWIGSDGKCEGTDPTTDKPCSARVCVNAKGDNYMTNENCKAYQFGCLSNGSGCVQSDTCLATQKQLTCTGTPDCLWGGICVDSECSKYTSVSMCINNLAKGRPCIWNGTICREKLCNEADKATHTSDEQCGKFMARCVYSGDGCQDSNVDCTYFRGDKTTCPNFIAKQQKCWSTSETKTSCIIRQCSHNTTATSDQDCTTFLEGCVTKGTGCISVSEPCSSYIGSIEQCKLFKGENGTKKCYKEDTNQQCRNIKCSDNSTATTDSECDSHLTGCLTKGNGCVTPDTLCSQYPGNSSEICSKFLGNGIPCWWESGSNCVDKKCSHKTTASGMDDCASFLKGCVYNGTGCQDKSLTCSTYTGNETTCSQYLGNGLQCTRKNLCTESECTEKTDANSHQDCLDYAPSCRYSGVNNSCISVADNCSAYTTMTAELCNSTTNSSGAKCYYANSACANRTCDLLASANSQSDCDQFLTGCIWTGTKCTNKVSACTNYTNFTQGACQVAKDLTNNLCWKSTSGTGSCEVRTCSQVSKTNATDCQNHLSTCTSNGTTCVNKQANCTSYTTNFTQAACKEAKTTGGALCWMETAGPGSCIARSCDQTVSTPSAITCAAHIQNSCTFNGTSCISIQSCTSYTGLTIPQCQQIVGSSGFPCQKISNILTDSCIERSCSDVTAPKKLSDCTSYLSKCTFDGLICKLLQTTCDQYIDFSQAACQATVTTTGEKCWKQFDEIGKCEIRTCTNAPIQTSETSCRSHLNTCTFNGSGCVEEQTTCQGYTDTNALNCQKLSAFNAGVATPCWLVTGTGSCINKSCVHNTTATTDQECETFLSGCVTTGKGCTSNTTLCSQLTSTQDGCSALIGNFKRCKGASDQSGECSIKFCQDNTTATSDSQCASYMTGCLTRGKGCIASTEPCSAYKGTQAQCNNFKGAGRTCTNTSQATSSTSCIERKCSDNTTATSDTECSNFQVGCITNGRGCTSLTSQCTSFFGTQTTCSSFIGNSGKQKCYGTSETTSQSCVIRVCTHNVTATTDSECETFLSGCITNGKGCVLPQACSAFSGTRISCQTFSATDKPCKGVSSTMVAACKAATCQDAPNSYDTDELCGKFKKGCVTNGYGCVSSISCKNYQSEKSCTANLSCSFINSCRSVALTSCTSFTDASTCISTPVKTQIGKCAWDNINNGCRNWQCSDAPLSVNTHAGCTALNSNCTTRGSGCVNKAQCSEYLDQSICLSAKSILDDTCVWDSTNNTCRKRNCSDAPKALKTDEGCNTYLPGCLTTGYGCVAPPFDCTANITQTRCLVDSAGNPCIWLNTSNKCQNYTRCTDIQKTTFQECQAYSLFCTSDGINCVPFSLCAYYTTPNSCLQGTDGLCGWQADTNKCVKFNSCEQFISQLTSQCSTFNSNCVSDGKGCITKLKCTEYTAEMACLSGGTDGYCKWENSKCRIRQCSDATEDTTVFESCWKFSAEKVCTTNGSKCIDITTCSSYAKSYCKLGTDGYCTYDDTNQLCRTMICSDNKDTTSALCSKRVGLKCVSDGTKCIDIAKCSAYSDKEACNGGGTDGICAFTPSQNNPLVGICKLMTSCQSAGQDQIACSKAPCIFNNNACGPQTCASQQQGNKCNSIQSFDKKTITVCVPDGNGGCSQGDASSLSSSLCFELSGRTYSWNPSKSKCEKCAKANNNNSTDTPDDGEEEEETIHAISLKTAFLLLFGFISV